MGVESHQEGEVSLQPVILRRGQGGGSGGERVPYGFAYNCMQEGLG